MATFEYTDTDFDDATLSSSADMNANFEDVRDFLTTEIVHTDGTIPMTVPLVVHSQSGASSATTKAYYEQQNQSQLTVSGTNAGLVTPAHGYPNQHLLGVTFTPPAQSGVLDVVVNASGYLNYALYPFVGAWLELLVNLNGTTVTGIREHQYAAGGWANMSCRFFIPYVAGTPNTLDLWVNTYMNNAQWVFVNDGYNRVSATTYVTELV